MSHSEVKISKMTKSVQSGYGTPIDRSRLLGWADKTLSKLKSDKNFLRKTVKKTRHEAKTANDHFCTSPSKKDKHEREEVSELKPNKVATYVSEIVTSKLKRKVQHMAFDTSVTRDKQKNKGLNEEHVTNAEASENGDEQKTLKSKHGLTTSCSDDQEGDLYGHEICTKKKKRKYNESTIQTAVSTSSEVPLSLSEMEPEERPRKKKKLTKHYRSDRVNYYHCCKCASKQIEAQKTEANKSDETSAFDYSEPLSDSRKVKKYKMHRDYYTVNENESASEKMENTYAHKQDKLQKSNHTVARMLEKGNQTSDGDILKRSPKVKKKEKRFYTHLVSEECMSEKKKLKKYKLCTEKYEPDESRPNSENDDKVGSGDRCESSSKHQEKEVFEGYCTFGEKKKKKKKHKHGYSFDENLEETEKHNLCYGHYKTESASKRRNQKTDKINSHDDTVEFKKKKKNVKDNTYSKSETTSEETEEPTECNCYGNNDSGPLNKKKREKVKESWKVNENISDLEQRSKKKLYSDRNSVNTVEVSAIQEKHKKKHKEVEKENYYNSSLYVEEGGKKKRKKKRHKDDVSTDENLKTDEFIEDDALSDVAFSNTKYSVKKKDKTKNKKQSQTEELELEKSKKKKASLLVSKEGTDDKIKETTVNEDDIEYQESNWSPELTVAVSNSKETKNKREKFARINTLHSKNIKQSRKNSNFGLSPIFRLLAAESEFCNTGHACQTCCKCKPHPDVGCGESAESMSKNISNVVIKIEPGIKIKQEKVDVNSIDPYIMDKQMLAVKEDLRSELSTDIVDRTDDGVRNTESHDKSIDNLAGKEEQAHTGSASGPSEYSVLKKDMRIDRIGNNKSDVGEYVEGFSNECVANGNKETDFDMPYHNIYDDKMTVKEEILHFINTHDHQNDGRQHMEVTPGVNLKFVEKQNIACMDGTNELPSVSVLDSAYNFKTSDVQSVKEVNGLNVGTASKCETLSMNELKNSCNLEVIPQLTAVQNNTWNAEHANSLCWSSIDRIEQQTPRFYDVGAFTTGQVNFTRVPSW
jgi:hypothetical protein